MRNYRVFCFIFNQYGLRVQNLKEYIRNEFILNAYIGYNTPDIFIIQQVLMKEENVSNVLNRLSQGPQCTRELSSSINLELFLSTLRSEGMEFELKEEHCTLKNSRGYGKYSLSWRLGCPVHFLDSCTSTNTLAHRFVDSGPFVLVSDEQTAGKGRLGRSWESESGKNILCSFILRPQIEVERAPRCSLLWAAAIAEYLDIFVKWPNDLFHQNLFA